MKTRPKVNAALATMVAAAGLARPVGACAGESEWATAGKILAGVVGAVVIGEVLRPCDRPAAVLVGPPVRAIPVGEPCEIVYTTRERPHRPHWRPGRYEWRETRVREPGRWEVEARQFRRGHRWVEVRERVWIPGGWVTQRDRVWVPGGYDSD